MKRGKGIGFAIVLVIVVFAACSAFLSITVANPDGTATTIIPGMSSIRLGIDVRGGVEAVFEPEEGTTDVSDDDLDAARSVMELRLDSNNIADREVTVDYGNKRIIVRFPWKSTEKDFNPQDAITELGAMGHLTFQDVDGNILLEGSDVQRAQAVAQQGQILVLLDFKPEGAEKFGKATESVSLRGAGENFLAIYMDEDLVSAPRCESAIYSSSCQIENIESLEEASRIANTINAGALPFKLVSNSNSSISPTLGQSALDMMLLAGVIAYALIAVFMIIYYRLPGVIAAISLIAQIAGQLLVLSVTQYTLTLPGIAGIILAIGMGVDCNVITTERIKEELYSGKSIRASIDTGYKRAFTAILDGNVTIAIAAVLLWILGTGSMISFGITLFTGVVLNIICGVLLSRIMNKSLSGLVKKKWLYGYNEKKEAAVKGGEVNA